ncbi:flagellar hook-length control protein FliK [Neobacillus sp. K501]
MDISQIQIKINQTSLADSGKTKSNKPNDASVNSFNQVLAMFNLLGQQSEQLETTNIQGDSEVSNTIIDPAELDEEDLQQLDSLLTSMVELLQSLQQSLEKNETEPSSHVFNPNNQLNQLQQNAEKIGQDLARWLQKLDGLNEPTSTNENEIQLIQKLANLMNEIKPNEKNSSILNNIEDKLQLVLNEFDNIKQIDSPETNVLLSLDKNLVLFSPEGNRNITQNENGRFNQDFVNEPVHTNGSVFISTDQQIQGNKSWSSTNEQQSLPTMSVNDFVPEVSDFVGSYMRIFHNQNGSTEAKFLLSPDHLGQIEVKLTVQNGEVSAQILADTNVAKEALEAQLQQLKQALTQQGLTVQKLDVVQQTPQSFDLNQNNQPQSFSQDTSHSDKRQSADSSEEGSKKQHENDHGTMDVLSPVETKMATYGGAMIKSAPRIDFTA